ncbi:hypothetical protein [Undibacterium sp. Ren11W]|uniref:hypothetical protein n=1 Tax=Undibacterium sp. Ren11W TaxID=3413045 RepID=UPI003BF0D1CB
MKASELFGSGGVEIGGIASFPSTTPNLVTINGRSYLRTGVLALQAAYPVVPTAAIVTFSTATPVTRSAAVIPLAYAAGVFVGLAGNVFQSSPDGIAWTSRGDATNGSTWNAPNVIIWCSVLAVFIAIGYHGMWTSPNGTAWTVRAANADTINPTYAATDGTITISGGASTIGRKTINGTSWAAAVGWNTAPNSIAFGAGLFVVSTTSGIWSSTDGVAWLQRLATNAGPVAFGGGVFVTAPQAGGTSFRSADGITWTASVNNQFSTLLNHVYISYANGIFVAAYPSNAVIATSVDGNNWRNVTLSVVMGSPSNSLPCVYGNGTYQFAMSTTATSYAAIASYIDNFIASCPATYVATGIALIASSPVLNYLRIA